MKTEMVNDISMQITYLKKVYKKLETINPDLAINLTHIRNSFVLLGYIRIANEIRSYLDENSQILDWGCGIGQLLYLLNARNLKVSGFDMSGREYDKTSAFWQYLLKDSSLLERVSYSSDPVRLPYESHCFDAVVSNGVLEHVKYPSKSIVEIKRVLKKGGYFFIYELPNIYSYGDFIRKLMKKGIHPVRYTRKRIEVLLREAGYEIILFRHHSMLPRRMKHWEKLVPLLEIAPRLLDAVDNILSSIYPMNHLSQSLEVIAKKRA